MIRMIAVDLDGTLMTSQNQPPPDFGMAIERLHAHGVRVVIASGRQYYNLRKLFQGYEDKLTFLCENGALIFSGSGENLYYSELPPARLSEVLRQVNAIPTATPLLCGIQGAYLRHAPEVAERNATLYYEKRIFADDPLQEAAADKIVKVAVFDRENAAQNCAVLPERFGNEFHVTLSGFNWVDFLNPGVDKGLGMRKLQDLFSIAPEECMAFGDYLNDYEMLQNVFHSYAMANAHEKLKAIARFEAPPNDDYGVMQILRRTFDYLVD